MSAPVLCPHCGERVEPVPVMYGYPMPEAWEAAKRGELVIGGCVPDFGPEAICPACRGPMATTDYGDDAARPEIRPS